ncbi:MAG: hypothetical protein Q9183_006554 [Haloplaca sp. 2 TL-2023]
MSSARDVIKLADIPTVSQMYKSGYLKHPNIDVGYMPKAEVNARVALIRTSITDLEVTSIVNAANTGLLGGGGVDGAIHNAAGPDLLEECETLGGCNTGSAKMTGAYELPSKHIIHAVGPVYARENRKREGLAAELLTSCYDTSLRLAAQKGGSVAFSCLSTGVYGYPNAEAAKIASGTVRKFLETDEGAKIYFPPTPDEIPSSESNKVATTKESEPMVESEAEALEPSSTKKPGE